MATSSEWLALADRVMARIGPSPEDDCWIWPGSKNSSGYGQIWHGERRKIEYVHRIMCFSTNPNADANLFACHSCNTPPCCNPKHLYLATNKQNLIDASRDGLLKSMSHEDRKIISSLGGKAVAGRNLKRNGVSVSAKLSPDDVRAIREMNGRARDIAAQFGVSRKNIEAIRAGRVWQWVR